MRRAAAALMLATACLLVRDEAASAQAASGAPKPPPKSPPAAGRLLEVAGFATIGSTWLAPRKSLDAVLGSSSGGVTGGGGQVTFLRGPLRNVFARVDVSRFRETGERVFVFEGEVFGLGIPETITLTPVELTVGYRKVFGRRAPNGQPGRPFPVVPYAGLGVGAAQYEETSAFAEAGDNVDTWFTSWHVLGGVDIRLWRMIGAGVEGVYRWIPDALGDEGVSAAFNETNLNGATLRARLRVAW